jgi:C4-dicarboxylate-specific signal transduction histidine kinase
VVAVVLGLLVDRQKRQQQETLAVENMAVLGRAAAAVGHEMNDLLGTLKRLTHKTEGLQCTTIDRDFDQEMARLEKMIEVLSSFGPATPVNLFFHDLNAVIRDRMQKLQETARKEGIQLVADLDKQGCPTRIDAHKIGWVLDNLFKNALEVSKTGQKIHIRSFRGGSYCRVEVQDEGPGIQPEHLSKIFTPFFSTKENGQGLALAGSKKILCDFGGDIQVKSRWGEGATFILGIPREDSARPLQDSTF